MTIIENGKYRLQTILVLKEDGFKEQPPKFGLAIEKKCKNGNSWVVVLLIFYDENECCCKTESCGERILDIEDDEWETVRRMIKAGCEVVACANQ